MEPWNEDVRGNQVPALIGTDARYVRVEAGPGTGKTFGLVRRVERILHPNGLAVLGNKVLVVAFNRVIAQQLETEISERLTQSGFNGPGPIIRTIHALCMSIAGAKRLLLPHEVDAMLYDITVTNPRLLKTYNKHDKIEQALSEHEAGHVEHTELWLECEKWLVRHKANLISDLPKLLLDRLKAGDLPDSRYTHIIVDEFQDLTPGEQQLMVRLLEDGGSLTALGDPRQSIYHFRGNDLEGLQKLEALTNSTVHDVEITECQRCPAQIVEAANRLMADQPAAPMEAASSVEPNNHIVVWNTLGKEIEGMSSAIVKNVQNNPNDRHLIMVTRRGYGYRLRDAIKLSDPTLDVNASFSEGILETWPAREAFILFSLMTIPDAATWRAWLSYQQPGADGAFKAAQRNAPAYLNLLQQANDKISADILAAVASNDLVVAGAGKGKVKERAQRYTELASKYGVSEPKEFLETIFDPENWDVSSCSEPKTARANLEIMRESTLAALDEVQSEDESLDSNEMLAKVAARLRGEIGMREPLTTSEGPKVQIATLWSAKGVTAEHVYVVGLNKEMIPGERRSSYPGTDVEYYEEQKRLFYVTITRSKKTLVLSRSLKMKRQDVRQMGISVENPEMLWSNLSMSPFLGQIISLLPDGVDGANWSGC